MQITCQHKNLSEFFWNINIFNSNSNVFIFLYKKNKIIDFKNEIQ